ncbi:MAG: exodeoxyribonuclease I [Candidatus Saccharibacteria bacterium]
MANSFYFYDLETSGINSRSSRIMQFGGQRTDLNIKPIGEPDNFLIKLTPDILPEPDAILITGITPQITLQDGIREVEFLKYFHQQIALPDTIFVGFNSVRFDDEFVRNLNYRNFFDAYEWQWQQGRSKWDMLDVSRMTRALRPDDINWPFASDGKPSNKLDLLAKVNNLVHDQAHDALSDVNATIELAKLIKQKQPKLFSYLLNMRNKQKIEELISKPEAFVYSSGRYESDYLKTTVAVCVATHPTQKGTIFVYDLRHDPKNLAKKTAVEIADLLFKYKFNEGEERLPIKQMQFNHCPAVAPLSVLDEASKERLKLDMNIIEKNAKALMAQSDLSNKIQEAVKINEKTKQVSFIIDTTDVDSQLYDGFFNDSDKNKMRTVRAADKNSLADLNLDFADSRLDKLLMLYKARQYPESLNPTEQTEWEKYRKIRLLQGDDQSSFARYFKRINELSLKGDLTQDQIYLLEELKLYGESIAPM